MEIQIERREITVFASSPSPAALNAPAGNQPAMRPTNCPVCGASEMLPLSEGVAISGLSVAALSQGIETKQFHLHQTPSGECWVCLQSLPKS
jgi:hypothetical protein